ncbi:MAG TPA: hypothetical protein VFD13_08630 [Candidatus Kapabacteria bacterium]|nr:hypothetical protein [Candidatus Kapabacteria bacterium]
MTLAVFLLAALLSPVEHYTPPRPSFVGIHIAMPEDSAFLIMRRIAVRYDTLSLDSLLLLESDSVQVFGQPAYIQLQLLHHRVHTIVINWHPLGGTGYVGLRDVLQSYLERYFGRGVIMSDETLTYHRWETEDGTSELSHSDKYFRIFVRLGKPR